MPEDTDESDEHVNKEALEEMAEQEQGATLTVEFPLDDFHDRIVEDIEGQSDIEVARVIAGEYLPEVEQSIHRLYQEGKYSQQPKR